MSYRYDRTEPADAYGYERSEQQWAQHIAPCTGCDGPHAYMPDGQCRWCGDQIDTSEL